jgi:hypothetical protein
MEQRMATLVKKEWLLANVHAQRDDVDKIILKLNMKIREAKQNGYAHYVWEAYETKENPDDPNDSMIENVDNVTLSMVMDEIKEAGYETKVFEDRGTSVPVRVDISWAEKPPEPPPRHNEEQHENKMRQLRAYDRTLELYQSKLDLAISNNYSYKIAYYQQKIEEILNLRAMLLVTM